MVYILSPIPMPMPCTRTKNLQAFPKAPKNSAINYIQLNLQRPNQLLNRLTVNYDETHDQHSIYSIHWMLKISLQVTVPNTTGPIWTRSAAESTQVGLWWDSRQAAYFPFFIKLTVIVPRAAPSRFSPLYSTHLGSEPDTTHWLFCGPICNPSRNYGPTWLVDGSTRSNEPEVASIMEDLLDPLICIFLPPSIAFPS